MNRQQRRKLKRHGGVENPSPASQPGISSVQLLFARALDHAHAGRLSEATELFRQVLIADPRHAGSLYNLGVVALRIGHVDDAINLSRQAIELEPGHAEAHGNLAAALASQGQLVKAAEHGEKAVQYRPDLVSGYQSLATIYAGGNDMLRALGAVMRGLKVKETPQLKSMFAQCLRHPASVPDSKEFRRYVVRALDEPWARPADIARTCAALIKLDPCIAGAIDRATGAWPERLSSDSLFGPDGLAAVCGDPLLSALLRNARMPDIAMERFLTMARSVLLDAALSPNTQEAVGYAALEFFCALAQQCFNNEYVFACPEHERARVDTLRDKLANAIQSGEPVDPLVIAAFAAYAPLHELPQCERLLAVPWSDAINALLTQQLREPLAERQLRNQITRLTAIDDDVSALVREQYEENPYPRWVKSAATEAPKSLGGLLKSTFPHAICLPVGREEKIDLLVAGCGTGQQVVDLASSISDANILAVDLSLASLAYAKYRTDAMGLASISYAQADILKLASLGRSFHAIACTGVLHHLRDPLEGWRILLSLLRPNGVMRIALYSELARADIIAGRRFIAERGYGTSAEDIRRCRQDLMSLGEESPLNSLTTVADFFATSDCRDLLFHVQEHRFTLPQIKHFLDNNGLRFLGFLNDHPGMYAYAAFFPNDRARINLDNWHQFETQNPNTFRGMYQFWAQKIP
jgi:2-polyprenyl-3-methyl-5-hydroxy-6-metoxy-1,4-benzoquinol methylase